MPRYETSSRMTKEALAASLRKQMEKKSLSKITVSDIVADTGVNRKTFYYHFEDIFALVKWMLEQETIEVVKHYDLLADFPEVVTFIIEYVQQNRHILNCAYDAMGRDGLMRFFYDDTIHIVRKAIDAEESSLGIETDPDYKDFLCDFYTEAIAGILLSGFRDRHQKVDTEKLVYYIEANVRSTLPAALAAVPRSKP